MLKLSCSVISLVASSAIAIAQPAQPPAETTLDLDQKSEPVNSINVSPLGVLVGNYALTYERLFGGYHGLIVEGIASHSSNDDGTTLQFGGGVGYRFHWRGRQNSGFLGVMFAQGFGNGEVTIGDMTHPMSVRSTTVTANVGKRWMIGPANITFRLGLGWGNHVAEAKEDSTDAKEAEEVANGLLAFLPIGFDGELSVGYTF
jgi:hypothetical protein